VWLLGLSCVSYLYHRGRVQEMNTVLALALDAARRLDDTLAEARVLHATGRLNRAQRGNRASAEVLRQALDLLTTDGEQLLRAQILSGLGHALMPIDPYGEALPNLEEAARLARLLKHDRTLVQSLTYSGILYSNARDDDNALKCLEAALVVFERLGPIPLKADALCCISAVYGRLGKVPEALDAATAGYDLAVQLNNRFSLTEALAKLGDAHRLKGDPAKAVEVHREGVGSARVTGAMGAMWGMRLSLAESLLANGDFDEAKAEFDEVLRTAMQEKDNLYVMSAWEGLAGYADRTGEPEQAADLLHQALAIADEYIPTYAPRLRTKLEALT
jgi:tetratricopeptide (TPR) repeat protein